MGCLVCRRSSSCMALPVLVLHRCASTCEDFCLPFESVGLCSALVWVGGWVGVFTLPLPFGGCALAHRGSVTYQGF